jgi:hypothetical protein
MQAQTNRRQAETAASCRLETEKELLGPAKFQALKDAQRNHLSPPTTLMFSGPAYRG